MKKLLLLVLLIVTVASLCLASINAAVPAGFVYRQGTGLYIDGKPYYFAGCNSYDLFTYGDGSNDGSPELIETLFMNKAGIDLIMSQMAADGVKVVRTWGFSHETWHGFETAKGVYNEAQFMEFDYILESAKKYGIKVIIALENYWEAYGGIDTRLKWEGLPGGTHANRAKFFTTPGCKTSYKNFVNKFVTRVNHYTNIPYKDDPTIFSWELMNEPRYQDAGENSTGTTLRAWVDEMAAYIKSLDPNHMVGIGIEGHEAKYGFGGDEGNPFIYLHQSPYIDYCTAHPYPDEPWANLSVEQTRRLIEAWISDAHDVVGKPFIMGEWNVHSNKELYWPAMLDEIEHHNAAGSQFWNYNDYTTSNFDMLYADPILTTYFKPHSDRMAAKSGPVVTPPPVTPTPVRVTPTPVRVTPTPVTITPTPVRTPTAVRTATPRVTPTPITPPGGGIKVQFYNQSTAATTNQLYLNLRVVNTGNGSIALSNVKMRYYYTIDGAKAQNFYCDWSSVGSSNLTSTFVSMAGATSDADTYVEIGFNSGAGNLDVGGSATVQGRVAKSDWSSFTQTNDYSFNSTATSFVDWTKVTGFVSGALAWGVEPGINPSTPTPVVVTPTPVPVTPTPVVVTPTPVPVTPTPVVVTPTPVRTATPVVATPTPVVGGYVVTYSMNDWGSGATVTVTIKNNTATAVNGWTLAWTFPGNQMITNLWSGAYTQSGASVTVEDLEYNANIPANGGTISFGFNMSYSGTNAIPADFTLNGTACQVQ